MRRQQYSVQKCMKKIDETVSLFFIRSHGHLDNLLKAGCKRVSIISLGLIAAIVFSSPAWSGGTVSPGETHMFTEADRGDGTPFFDSVLKGTNSFWIPQESRAESIAILTIAAFNSTVSAFGSVITDFDVTSGSNGAETVLDATVSADVEWNGVLFGAGILGAKAVVTIEMFLVDETTGLTTAQTLVVSKSQDSTGLKGIDVGGTVFSGTKKVTFAGKVVRGHMHSLALKVTCEANSGLIGLDVGCVFFDNAAGLGIVNGFAKWNNLAITVEQDLFDLLVNIQASIDDLQADVDVIRERQLEEIRLLTTPQGRRQTDVPACEGEGCDFPETTTMSSSGNTAPSLASQASRGSTRASRGSTIERGGSEK